MWLCSWHVPGSGSLCSLHVFSAQICINVESLILTKNLVFLHSFCSSSLIHLFCHVTHYLCSLIPSSWALLKRTEEGKTPHPKAGGKMDYKSQDVCGQEKCIFLCFLWVDKPHIQSHLHVQSLPSPGDWQVNRLCVPTGQRGIRTPIPMMLSGGLWEPWGCSFLSQAGRSSLSVPWSAPSTTQPPLEQLTSSGSSPDPVTTYTHRNETCLCTHKVQMHTDVW